jgi:hypothetical protein
VALLVSRACQTAPLICAFNTAERLATRICYDVLTGAPESAHTRRTHACGHGPLAPGCTAALSGHSLGPRCQASWPDSQELLALVTIKEEEKKNKTERFASHYRGLRAYRARRAAGGSAVTCVDHKAAVGRRSASSAFGRTIVLVPDERDKVVRNLSRAQEDAVRARPKARQQLAGVTAEPRASLQRNSWHHPNLAAPGSLVRAPSPGLRCTASARCRDALTSGP